MGDSVYEEVVRWPKWVTITAVAIGLVVPEALILVVVVAYGQWGVLLFGAFYGFQFAFKVNNERTLRIVVDNRSLRLKMGWIGENLPLQRILACTPGPLGWFEWGRWQPDRWRWSAIYKVRGWGGSAAKVKLNSGRTVLFSTRDPHAVCRALLQGRPEIRIE